MHRVVRLLFCAGLALASCPWAAAQADDDATAFFESKIRPILIERCYRCHSDTKSSGGLLLDSRAGWQAGGDSGPTLVPGNPAQSLLIQAISYTDENIAMPPADAGGKLADAEIALLTEWVQRGAPDPRVASDRIGGMTAEEARGWWSFQPITTPPVPDIPARPGFVHNDIDRFLQARLDAAGVTPAPPADRRTLIRRLTFDLTGLPPTPEEVAAFVADEDPQAVAHLIDRLLARPQYGERWGRHWLDVVRYADSFDARGFGSAGDISEAWRYRDWVVNALNRDLPYDEFLRQQIAGDLLAPQREPFDPGLLVATGVYAIGHWGNGDSDKQKVHTDIVDDQIDLTSRAFMGLTLSCARCHDHKFDALTTRDYYALSGFFFSSRILDKFAHPTAGEQPMRVALLSPAELQQLATWQARVAEIDGVLQQQLLPLERTERNARAIEGFFVRRGSDDTPSLVANLTGHPMQVLTFSLPPQSVALHPGPTMPITAAWTSPISGVVRVELRLRDADPVGGDGIAWELRQGDAKLASGSFDNGGSDAAALDAVAVQKDELLRLVILPRDSHTCDTTLTEFTIVGGDGQRWDLREALLARPDEPQDAWAICQGDAARLPHDSDDFAALVQEQQALLAKTGPPAQAHGLAEGGIPDTAWAGFHDGRVHKRGRYDQLGDVVPRGFPAILTAEAPAIGAGSGRLALAAWLTRPDHPLTARVIVNRVWQQHFGAGLVRTANNFGKLGERPSHPELLDWLAARFVAEGWSLKTLHRHILLSAAWQRSVAATPSDPDNRLLAHQRRRKLSAEELRDALLHVTGELDHNGGGPPTRDVMSPRRTLYLATIRSEKSNFQTLFDGANAETIVEQRTESVVAPQALWLLNSDFVLARAKALAVRVAAHPGDRSARLDWLCQQLYQRPPASAEQTIATQAVADAASPSDWEALCQVLLCSNEFVYVE